MISASPTGLGRDDDRDAAVPAAAAVLLERGGSGWAPVTAAYGRADDVGVSEALRSAVVDRLVAGDPGEALLLRLDDSADEDVRDGAEALLIDLGFRSAAAEH